MKRIAIVIAATALAACSNKAAPEPSETATAESSIGSYDVTQPDGSRMISVLNANGTYTDSVNGEVTESGTWEDKDDGSTCFTPAEGSTAQPRCYTTTEPAADGSFTATPDNGGDPIKVKRI